MPIADDIAAIRAGSGTEAEKRAQVYALKSGSLYDALLPWVRKPFPRVTLPIKGVPTQIEITLWDVWLIDSQGDPKTWGAPNGHVPGGDQLRLSFKVVRVSDGFVLVRPSGSPKELTNAGAAAALKAFVNPPVLTKAGLDDRITAAREMLAGVL